MTPLESITACLNRITKKYNKIYIKALRNFNWDFDDDYGIALEKHQEILKLKDMSGDYNYETYNLYAPDGYKKESKNDN